MKKAIRKLKYAVGGEIESLDTMASLEAVDSTDSTTTGDPTKPPTNGASKGPITEEQWNALKTKYAGNLPQVKPFGASAKGSALDKRMKWVTWANQKLPTSGTPAELSAKAAKVAGIDPGMLLASSLEEGVGLRFMGQGADVSNAYAAANEKGELTGFPVDAFRNYGLDQIGGRVDEFVKKGWLPPEIKSKMKTFYASNELDEKEYYQKAFNAIKDYEGLLPKDAQFKASGDFYSKLDNIMDEYEIEGIPEMRKSAATAAFRDDESAYMAKAAFLRSEQENVLSYAKQKGYKLTPEETKFFTMAAYNGGSGNGRSMLDFYHKQGKLGNNGFLKTRANKGQIYDNIMPRYAGANLFTGEGYFEYGGKIPKKPKGVPSYAEGGEMPLDTGDDPPKFSDQENYYRSSAKLAHYKGLLNERLKKKNPEGFTTFFQGLSPLRRSGQTDAANKYIQEASWNDYLSPDEVKQTLGDTDYSDYLDSIKSVNAYDVAQGRQPLYGTKETGTDINSLNYGRRFASLALTPSFSSFNQTRGTSYNRSYSYDPTKREVSYTETGDIKQRPNFFSVMKMGGKVPKYQDGTEDPITGQPKNVDLKAAPGFNPFGSFPSTSLNPQAPLNEQIYPLDPNQVTTNQQGRVVGIDPLEDGNYVNSQGQLQATAEQQAIADQRSADNLARANRNESLMDDIETGASLGITAINSFFNKRNQQRQNNSNRRNTLMQAIDNQIYNPYAEGTGSQAIMKDGGKIYIKPENRGKFTAAAKRAGMGVQEYANKIMAHPENYSPTLRKRANFARNAAKWHEFGGEIDNEFEEETGVQTLDGGQTRTISTSDHSNPMIEFIGKDHKNGGIGIQYGGNIAEVENKEVGWVDDEGNLNIFGKLKLPGTSMTFRQAAKNLAEQEGKVDKQKHKYLSILNNSNAADPYQESARSTAKVMTKSLDNQSREIAEKKEAMASYQSLVLAMTQADSKEMAYGGTMPKRPNLQTGAVLSGDPIKDIAKAIGQFESGASYNAIGVPVTKGQYKGQRALGKYQIMEDNMRSWGKAATGRDITVDEFIRNPALQDQIAEFQMREIAKTHPNPQDIASIWFTGRPTSNRSAGSATDDLGTSGNQYVRAVMNIYNGISGGTNNIPTANQQQQRVTTPVPDIMSFSPKKTYSPTAGGDVINTQYGSARRQPSVFQDEARVDNTQTKREYQSPLAIEQIAPELLTIATNRRDPVTQLSYQPELKQTFDISYQLGRNENQSTFNQAAKIAEQTGNVGALSEMAAQKYKADQVYNMQEVQGNAQQRLQTYNQNIDALNDAQLKNLALTADQQTRQAQATFNTRATDLAAFQSIAGKVQQNRLENVTYNAYANLFKHYGFDKKGNVTFNPDNITRRFSPGEAQQFGMMAAQQGAQAILNGDFSRQFTKVKNPDGSQTTTETLGRNKKIREEYDALHKQGFDDTLIGNMLRAKYPETISE